MNEESLISLRDNANKLQTPFRRDEELIPKSVVIGISGRGRGFQFQRGNSELG